MIRTARDLRVTGNADIRARIRAASSLDRDSLGVVMSYIHPSFAGEAVDCILQHFFQIPFAHIAQYGNRHDPGPPTECAPYLDEVLAVPPLASPSLSHAAMMRLARAFPACVGEIFYWAAGANDDDPWLLLFAVQDTVASRSGEVAPSFGYFTAWCDYTGFDCSGGMKLYLARDLDALVTFAMSDPERTDYAAFINSSSTFVSPAASQ